eukprot:32281_1
MAASSNRNESYIIKDLMMTLMTWYSSFLYQIIMDSPQQLARTTFSLHNHGTDHNHQETQHMMTIRSTTQYTISIHQTHPIITGYDSTLLSISLRGGRRILSLNHDSEHTISRTTVADAIENVE